jgi:hypothetical protein
MGPIPQCSAHSAVQKQLGLFAWFFWLRSPSAVFCCPHLMKVGMSLQGIKRNLLYFIKDLSHEFTQGQQVGVHYL